MAVCLASASSVCGAPKMSVEDDALLRHICAFDRDGAADKYYKNPDSGNLGWGESSILNMFSDMYHVTGDTHWLDRLVAHADVVIGSAAKDSRGRTGWFTKTYSLALCEVSADPANKGGADLGPARQSLGAADRVAKVHGHTYLVSVRQDGSLEVYDQTAKSSAGTAPKGQAQVQVSEFFLKLTGSPSPGDSFLVKTTAAEATDYIVHDGMILRPIADFIETVSTDTSLRPKYGAAAERYLACIEKYIVPKWDERWRDFPAGGGAYLATNLKTHRYPDIVLPHNQYLALGRVFFPLYRATHNKAYLERATKMARFFNAKMSIVDGGYIWNYWDAARPEDAPGQAMCKTEDTSHGAIDVGFAVDAYEAGVVFTRQDIDRIALNYSKHIWNRSVEKPGYCLYVDRRRDPAGEKDKTAVTGWQLLSRYSPEVAKAVEPAYRHGYRSAPAASEWLRTRYTTKGISDGK